MPVGSVVRAEFVMVDSVTSLSVFGLSMVKEFSAREEGKLLRMLLALITPNYFVAAEEAWELWLNAL